MRTFCNSSLITSPHSTQLTASHLRKLLRTGHGLRTFRLKRYALRTVLFTQAGLYSRKGRVSPVCVCPVRSGWT